MSRSMLFIDGLVERWRAIDGHTSPGGSGIPVFDGPCETSKVPRVLVVVGAPTMAADDDTDPIAATSSAEWVSVPATSGSVNESVTVACAVTAWTGDAPGGFPDWATLRGQVSDVVADLLTDWRTNGRVLDEYYLALSNGRLMQEFTTEGAFVTFEFDTEARFNL